MRKTIRKMVGQIVHNLAVKIVRNLAVLMSIDGTSIRVDRRGCTVPLGQWYTVDVVHCCTVALGWCCILEFLVGLERWYIAVLGRFDTAALEQCYIVALEPYYTAVLGQWSIVVWELVLEPEKTKNRKLEGGQWS